MPHDIKNTVLLPLEQTPDRLVTGYDRDLIPWPGVYKIKNDNAAWASLAFTSGAMAANASDLLIDCLFSEQLLSKYFSSQMTAFMEVHDNDKPSWTCYGLGIIRFKIDGIEYWDHEGLFIGFESIAIYSPEKNYFITLIGNISSFDKFEIIKKLQEIILAER